MNTLKYLLSFLCLVMIVSVGGCVVVAGGPYAYDEVFIDVPPPPPPAVIITPTPRPSSLHIWIDGHYIVSAGSWHWRPGHWEQPRRRGMVWVPSHTRKIGSRWGWRSGHWR